MVRCLHATPSITNMYQKVGVLFINYLFTREKVSDYLTKVWEYLLQAVIAVNLGCGERVTWDSDI